jgi:hypothetical protein
MQKIKKQIYVYNDSGLHDPAHDVCAAVILDSFHNEAD